MEIKIITDSTSDITIEEGKERGIGIVPLNVIFEDKSYKEGIDIKPDKFYPMLKEAKKLPTTSQPSPEDFLKLFLEVKKAGAAAIVLLVSSKISGTVQSAQIAKELAEYDHIYIVDTLSSIMGLRLLVDYALKLKEQEDAPQKIVQALEDAKSRVAIYAVVDTLEYFLRGGRLSKSNAIVGSLLNLKPIVALKDGSLAVVGKARGTNNSITSLIKEMDKEGTIDLNFPIYFGYTENDDKCRLLINKTKEYFSFEDYSVHPVGCVIGTHAGPGASTIAYMKKK
ncbi:MAG: DegV family protein [Clostridiaceae bacterium]